MVPLEDGVFPTLQSCSKTALDEDDLFDIKFYPYETAGAEQIFAITAVTDTIVCRLKDDAEPPYEILQWFRDADENSNFNSIAWTQDPDTGNPWLCIAGSHPKHIKILDLASGDTVRTLAGHGRDINDLAVSPISTDLIASCAADATIRLWSLRPDRFEQPCVALLAGEGHRAPVLSIHFHHNGKWLLSGGIDTAVCLWAVPSWDDLENKARRNSEPMIVLYPHFFTKELHPNYVDCLVFYGDLILSKSARSPTGKSKQPPNEIILWEIEGFNADAPAPEFPPIPSPGQQSRSSFEHESRLGFRRLLTFATPVTDRFYLRFGFYHRLGARPILCMGNQQSQYCFWDLQKLEEGSSPQERALAGNSKKKRKQARQRKGLATLSDLRTEETVSNGESSSRETPDASTTVTSTTGSGDREYTLGDRFTPLEPHLKITANTKLSTKEHFATRQIAWSPDGKWMVATGDHGMICMFRRA